MEPSLLARPYVVLDLEFTGLSPLEGDTVLEVAALRLEDGALAETFHRLLNPGRAVPEETLTLTGIDPASLPAAPRFAEIAPQLLAFVADVPLVTHNLAYDLAALQWELARHGMQPLPNLGIDTLELARRVFPGLRNNLRDLATRLGIVQRPAHRALGDAQVTADAFVALVRLLVERGEARTLKDLHPVDARGFVLRPPGVDRTAWDTLTATLVRCVETRRQARIAYGATAASAAERIVDPFCLIGPYLRAYCHGKKRELNFLVSRIWKAEETGEPVTRMPEPPRGPAVFSPAWRAAERAREGGAADPSA